MTFASPIFKVRSSLLSAFITVSLAQTILAQVTYVTLDAPDAISTTVKGLEGNTLIGVFKDTTNPEQQMFRWNGSFEILSPPNSYRGSASSIDNGKIAGWYEDLNHVTHGFVWNDGAYTTLAFPTNDGHADGIG